MNQINEIFLQEDFIQELNYIRIILGIALSLICTSILRYFYNKRSLSFENKLFFTKAMYTFSLAILLIVIVIKSSLALSLGMVGALSVIRFRTAIKEPEQITTLLMTMALSIAIAAEKEILAIIFLLVYVVFNPKTKKGIEFEKSLLQIYINENINIFNYDLPSDCSKRLTKISNVDDHVIIEFVLENKNQAKSIIEFFEVKFKDNIKYELI